MRLPYLLLASVALVLQDPSAEAKRWWSHIEFLADDALEGRNVGTPGFEKAANYVESRFKEIGLTPAGVSGFRQPVKFESRTLVPEKTTIALVRDGEETPLAPRQEATLSARGELDGALEAPMVFVGYGLSIPDANWDDLAGVDLRGKIAVFINTMAPVDVPDSVKSHVNSAAERWAVLKKAGAIGVATLPSPPARGSAPAEATRAPEAPPTAGAPGAAEPAAAAAAAQGAAQRPQPTFVLADVELQEFAGHKVSMTLTRAGGDKLLAGSGHTMAELDQLVTGKKPLPRFAVPGTLRVRAALARETVDSVNLAGILEGSDPKLKNEFVVLSAHLDHVGVGRPVAGDSLYNGAMDDASGVASVIEIARMLKESGANPKRSIVFVIVTAEEKGLLGSKYFAARPTVPFENIVANVNLDMFLPLYPLKVIEVQGLQESSLGEAVRAAAQELGAAVQVDQEPEQNRFIRSDQYSFIRRGIPSLAFKFGYEPGSVEQKTRLAWVRDVYHKPNDDLKQPVDLEAAAKFNRVILALLQRVGNDTARPRWNDSSFFKRFAK